ncbi:hypothetical protein, partial [Amycolatopsis sp. NPDC051061]|uniref:hypothetical protein n=1 Tax=Amycolatopsis sp. NPDC051061 TaxID=3155042 RepID=UPI00344A2809
QLIIRRTDTFSHNKIIPQSRSSPGNGLNSYRFTGFVGWHEGMGDPDIRLLQRLVPYHLPLILIAVAPAIVAVPLALSAGSTFVASIPVLVVVACLLVVYVVELLRNRRLL